ncbi:Ubiquitinyl hydrolase 1 [Handroanthus impetiginosus]|uniref:Ubiquitinyl hydrolase 1 n=1 Tax=Handroanthus impetiginosus TaxID=429701 RepID=A0A2G9I321_9LAMI|nr:Ubiquitinyl hydrolase 1 [Handroanthus impetiginosus]
MDEEKIAIVAESLEVNEEKIAIVAESPEVNEDDCQPKDEEDDSKENIAKKVEEELISPKDTAVINELNDNEIPKEQADNYQPKDHEDDMEGNIVTEVDEDVISPDNIGVTKEDSENEEVEVGIAKAEDDMIMETSEDEEKVTSEDEEKGEANLSDEVKEDSVGTGDSSTESNSEAIWPAESLQETSVEPEKKLIDQEVEGKIQEDKPVEEGEYNSQDPYQVKAEESDSWKISANQPTQVVSSQFRSKNGDSDKTFVKKYAVNSTRWRMLIGALFVVLSLSCSWFFGLSFIKLGLIVFLTMVLSKIDG